MSIGCIAIGNGAIEEVFWAVYQAYPAHTRILISPVDFRKPGKGLPAGGGRQLELYRSIKAELARYGSGK